MSIMVLAKRIDLSNKFFEFRYGLRQGDSGEDPGIRDEWYKHGLPRTDDNGKTDILKVYVPSAWSYYQNRSKFNFFGSGWFQTRIYLPERWGTGDGKKVIIVFNGSNYKTTLWINGVKVGYHEGGFTKFWFNIGNFVKYGKDNLVVIRVDNRYKEDRFPWANPNIDIMNYGGIYRTLYLKVVNPINIDDYKISNEIEFHKDFGKGWEKPKAKINVRLKVKDARPYHRKFQGSLIFTVKNDDFSKSQEVPINLIESKEDYVDVSISIDNAHLWSPDNPYLYNLTFQLINKNRREVDREQWRWGIRDFKKEQDHFYLNNKKITLRGVNHIEDHPDVGSSLNPRLMYNDLNILKEANVNCIRTYLHPSYKALVEMADEMGFLILEDLPIYEMKQEQYNKRNLSTIQEQLWEMIHRDKNNCSVIAWVLGDGCDTSTEKAEDFFKQIFSLSKELDPFRLHTSTTENPKESRILDLLDFYAIKSYFGWYDDYYEDFDKVDKHLDEVREFIEGQNNDKKPIIISEFGAASVSGFKDFSNSPWSENYQYDLIEAYIEAAIRKDGFAGACVSCFQDFRTSPYGGYLKKPKMFDSKGIVDMHRNPKNSYYVVQELYKKWAENLEKEHE